MSTRVGKLQRAILEHLGTNPGTTFESLRWDLWACESMDGVLVDLPTKWDTSTKRALDSLVKRGDVLLTSRKLATIEECIGHFPHKCLRADTRRLRMQLLPRLFAMNLAPRHTPAENERYHLESLSDSQKLELSTLWSSLEPQLIALLPQAAEPARNQLFLVIAKGKELFETNEVASRRSMNELVSVCLDREWLPNAIGQQMKQLNDSLIDRTKAGFLRLKSIVQSLAYVPAHGRGWSLKDATIEHLEDCCHEVLASLPGYQPAESPRSRHLMTLERKAVQSKKLHDLFDHSVYTEFRFVRAA